MEWKISMDMEYGKFLFFSIPHYALLAKFSLSAASVRLVIPTVAIGFARLNNRVLP